MVPLSSPLFFGWTISLMKAVRKKTKRAGWEVAFIARLAHGAGGGANITTEKLLGLFYMFFFSR
jgi:hypothetical protein